MNYGYIYPIVKWGKPYIVKFFLYLLICILTCCFSGDSFSLSLNVTMFVSTVTVDMMLLESDFKFFKRKNIGKIQFAYLLMLGVILIVSIVMTLKCANNPQLYEENPIRFWALKIFMIPFGVISPVFELIYNIPLDKPDDND